MSKEEKKRQLGMDPGTASNRLVKDLLWNFIVLSQSNFCYRCGAEMCRDTFSVEHKEPWLHSQDPVGIFFDLDNIAFSHLSCNVSASRRLNKIYANEQERRKAKDKRRYWGMDKELRKKKRREKYLRTGT